MASFTSEVQTNPTRAARGSCACEPVDVRLARAARAAIDTDAGKLALGALGVFLLWRLVLPSEENQLPPQPNDRSS